MKELSRNDGGQYPSPIYTNRKNNNEVYACLTGRGVRNRFHIKQLLLILTLC